MEKGKPPTPIPDRKVCPRCRIEKEIGAFAFQRKESGNRRPTHCKKCRSKRTREWQIANPEKARAQLNRWQRRRNARAALYRELVEGKEVPPPEKLDAARRAFVEIPHALTEEGEMVAYFRGYVAGAKRSEDESKRFDALKDLVHRIASEACGKWHTSYEDALSAGYLAALNYLRKVTPEDPTHFRKKAAEAIRNGIIDSIRAVRGRAINGGKPQPVLLEAPETLATQDALEDHTWLEALDLHGRDKRIIKLLAQGLNQREVGERLGVTESRVNQLVKEIREKHGDRLLEVLSA